VPFRFNGRSYQGYAGDTLASALLANDVHLVGRSFKYHRPRGIFSAGSEEPNALVTIDRGGGRTTPNLRATQIELYPGLTARSQNHFPSLRFDLGAAAGWMSPLLSAGFYYKTFMWPPSFWHRIYEPAIRAAAGLGRAPASADPDRYAHRYAHCDVLVIGAGPAGLAAALAASTAGARVILCDEQAACGGSLLSEPNATIDGWPAPAWLAETLALLGERVTVLPRTTAFGWYPDNLVGLAERLTDHHEVADVNQPRERLWQVRASEIVLATGAIERPLVFPQNDRPGIMLAEAARSYLYRYGVLVGNRIVIATTGDSAYRVALDLHAAGAAVAAIIDQRPVPRGEVVDAALGAAIPIHAGATIAATEGHLRVHTARLSESGQVIPCDTVLMSGGWTPSVHLFSQARGSLRFDATISAFVPDEPTAPMRAAGACNGTFDLAACLDSGWLAGGGVERHFAVSDVPSVGSFSAPAAAVPHAKAFVDFQNDVTTRDLQAATREGFRTIEHVKRYTTTGMATDQGKTSNLNALSVVANALGQSVPEVGLTTFRPPYTPVTFGTFAGAARAALFDPVRHTPIAAPDAVFEDVGTWKRARCFPRNGEDHAAAVARECRALRTSVGLFDASTLGKIEVVGPDAAEFLNRIYTGTFTTLAPGRCRYTLLLGEDGFVRDDGVVARLASDRFHVTTTTGGAASVLHHMEDYLQTEFPELRVWLTSTTEQWAVIAVQGPRAADTIQPLLEAIDLKAMPHMSVRDCRVAGIAARLFRVSFTGEPGFEINVPAQFGQAVWNAVLEAGAPHDITRYGTDAMHVLRAEKGFIVVGQETDGTVTPNDLGLDWAIGKTKPDFVGKRSLVRPDMMRSDRKQLVGLLTTDPTVVLEEGAQVVAVGTAVSLGHVTSAYQSSAAGRSIALALISGGRSRIGSTLAVPMPDRTIEVTVTRPLFYEGKPAENSNAPSPLVGEGRGEGAATGEVRDRPLPRELSPLYPPSSAVRVIALAPTLRLNIRAGISAAATIGATLGVMLATVPCRAVTARGRAALWLGPDEWLVLAPLTETELAARLLVTLGTTPASIVDVSHRTIAIEVTGPRAAWCLNAYCALDLDPQSFPIGMCTRTVFAKAEILLWRLADETFYLEVARSFAPYVWACLEEARREFLDPPAA
jgi:sarcosine oxidase subunit alpha